MARLPTRVAESIEVDPWQWRQMLLTEYGPAIESHRLVALVIEAHMSAERPEAWPSQETIARRVQVSLRQVRRILDALEHAGWVRRGHRKRDGQKWRLTTYAPSVPLLLQTIVREHPWETDPKWQREDTQMSAPVSSPSRNGEDIQMSSAHSKREDTQMSPPQAKAAEVRTSSPDVRTSGAKGADISAGKVRTFEPDVRTSGCPTNSSSEVFIGSLQGSNHSEGALTRTRAGDIEAKIRMLKAAGQDAESIVKMLRCYRVTLDQVKSVSA